MLLSNVKFYVEDFFKFCGLLRISDLYYGKTIHFKDIFIILAARVHFHAKNGRTYFKGFIFATACVNGQIPGVNYLIM